MASAQDAAWGIEALQVLTASATLEDPDQPQVKRIVHPPDAAPTVRHVLRQIAAGEPTAIARTQFLPVLQRADFEWIGWTAWVVPGDDERRVRVTAT